MVIRSAWWANKQKLKTLSSFVSVFVCFCGSGNIYKKWNTRYKEILMEWESGKRLCICWVRIECSSFGIWRLSFHNRRKDLSVWPASRFWLTSCFQTNIRRLIGFHISSLDQGGTYHIGRENLGNSWKTAACHMRCRNWHMLKFKLRVY